MNDLAKRAVACKGWRWLKGCVLTDGGIIDSIDPQTGAPFVFAPGGRHTATMLPDLSAAATLGCLLALVRAAWVQPTMHVRPEGDMWRVWTDEPGARVYASEAEALVAALEAAP